MMRTARVGRSAPIAALTGSLMVLSVAGDSASSPAPQPHPALAEPDGRSHRGDRMVAADLDDSRVRAELSRRFRETQPLRFTRQGEEWTVQGADDFERRQDYFLRLLDYYWFSKQRLLGMKRSRVEGIFGPLAADPDPDQARITAWRDTLHLWFKRGRVSAAYYAMGY